MEKEHLAVLKSQTQPGNFDSKHRRPGSSQKCRDGTQCAKHHLDFQNWPCQELHLGSAAVGRWQQSEGNHCFEKPYLLFFFHVFNSQALNTSLADMILSRYDLLLRGNFRVLSRCLINTHQMPALLFADNAAQDKNTSRLISAAIKSSFRQHLLVPKFILISK